ncbi:MAG: hypothetical protein DCC57_13435 [Chloroflexi bacterium]|nr:MAG: hypothetical protein DCC57_13435 [Chloroflexota bacterium]
MRRRRWFTVVALLFVPALLLPVLLTLLTYSAGIAASRQQEAPPAQEDGQEYVVKAGDWLSKISQEFYGSTAAYPVIVDATNAKAESDPRFAKIVDPDVLRVGQLLWIPTFPDQPAIRTPTAGVVIDTAANNVGDGKIEGGEPATRTVRFVTPVDGATVPRRFDVEMAADGLTIEPAGEIHEGAGHFHILVDTDFIAAGELIPFDEQHLHFGKGQLTTTLELAPGVHVLRLQAANGAHVALGGEPYQDTITITVTGGQTDLPGVRFVAPQAGEVVPPRFDVAMAAKGLVIEPAGEIHEGAGHFHILVDADFIAPGELIPFDEQHLHFGKGQLTATLELAPGIHTLRLQAANGAHIAFEGEQYRAEITVTVKSP